MLVACVAGSGPAHAQAQPSVTVNGSAVDIAPSPIIENGRVFVPLRGVFEQLGASVVYSNGTINATGNGRDITLQIGSSQATVNNQPQTIDVAPFIVGASTYVPLRFISEALGDSVNWDEADSIAAIDTGGGSATYYTPGTASFVDTAPPAIPVYDQPEVPQPDAIWQPGYWAWGSNGYYWVPGTWVEPPQPNYYWTPGYWQWNNYGFVWNPGYWASAVGFYGGVNYGGGYSGRGYDGGRWSNNRFDYNTYVTNVNVTNIRNVYVNRTVYVNTAPRRISYNGGRGGLIVRPTVQQLAVAKDRHIGMTAVQRLHVQAAEGDRRLLASVNHAKPPVLAVARPLSKTNPAAGRVPANTADRVNAMENVAPAVVRAARAGHRQPVPAAVPHPPVPRPVEATAARAPAPLLAAPAPTAPRPAANAPGARPRPAPHVATAAQVPLPARPPVSRIALPAHAPPVAAAPVIRTPAASAAVPPIHHPSVYAAPPERLRAIPAPSRAPRINAAPPVRAQAAPAVRVAPPVRAIAPAPPAHVAPPVHAAPVPPAAQAAPAPPAAHAAPAPPAAHGAPAPPAAHAAPAATHAAPVRVDSKDDKPPR